MPKKKEEKKDNNVENKKEEIAKTYGIDLALIEHIKIDNGNKELLKFVDSKDRSVKLVDLNSHGMDVQTNYEEKQKGLSSAQSDDKKENAKEVFELDMKYKYNVVNLITISEFKNNRYKYKMVLNSLETVKRKKIQAILKGCKKNGIELEYISLDYAIGITDKGVVIDANYNYAKNEATLKGAETVSTKDNNISIEDNVDEIEIASSELGSVLDLISITEDGPVMNNNTTISIRGTEISAKNVLDIYNMPELLDKMNLNAKEKDIYRHIMKLIDEKVGEKSISSKNNIKQKKLVKKDKVA